MKKILLVATAIVFALTALAAKREKVIKINVQPQEAAIYVDNNLIG